MRRDRVLDDLRNKVADALIGFDGQGLTVTRKDGRVYVSMDEKLLFPVGQYPGGSQRSKGIASNWPSYWETIPISTS